MLAGRISALPSGMTVDWPWPGEWESVEDVIDFYKDRLHPALSEFAASLAEASSYIDYLQGDPLTIDGAVVINEAGADKDVRIEGDTATHLFVTDAGLDAVQIGDTTAGVIADFRATGIVLNENGADQDFRVESDALTHALFLNAETGFWGVNDSAPVCRFHITGTACSDYAGINNDTVLLLENNDNVYLHLQGATTSTAGVRFCDDNYNPPAGAVQYDFANEQMEFTTGGNELFYIKNGYATTANGVELAVGDFGAPTNPLHVQDEGTTGGWGGAYGGVVARFRASEEKHTIICIDAQAGYDPVLGLSEGGSCIWDIRNDASETDNFGIRYQVGGANRTDFQITNAGAVHILTADLTLADGVGLNLQEDITFTGVTGVNLIKMPDALADALSIQEGANKYLTFTTTNGSEKINFEKNCDFSGVTGHDSFSDFVAAEHYDWTNETHDFLTTGIVSAGADLNKTSVFGRAKIGYMGTADQASFAHYDFNTTTDYALKQSATGFTVVNAVTGQAVYFAVNSVSQGYIDVDGLHLPSGNNVYLTEGGVTENTITGSGMTLKNIYTGGGWARNLFKYTDDDDVTYFAIGGEGTGQVFTRAYLGVAYNDTWMVWSSQGVGINQTTWGDNSVGVCVQGTGTAPTTSPADAFQMYSADIGGVAGKAGVHFRGEDDSIVSIGSGGVLMSGTARVTKCYQITNAALGKGSTKPDEIIVGNYWGWSYDIDDDSVFTIILPDDWAVGTDVLIYVRWAIDEAYATANGEVRWEATWSATPADSTEAIDVAGTTDNSGDVNIPATAYFLTETLVETIPGASLAAGDEIGITLKRVAIGDGTDPTADPVATCVGFTYTADKLGEAT